MLHRQSRDPTRRRDTSCSPAGSASAPDLHLGEFPGIAHRHRAAQDPGSGGRARDPTVPGPALSRRRRRPARPGEIRPRQGRGGTAAGAQARVAGPRAAVTAMPAEVRRRAPSCRLCSPRGRCGDRPGTERSHILLRCTMGGALWQVMGGRRSGGVAGTAGFDPKRACGAPGRCVADVRMDVPGPWTGCRHRAGRPAAPMLRLRMITDVIMREHQEEGAGQWTGPDKISGPIFRAREARRELADSASLHAGLRPREAGCDRCPSGDPFAT